MSTGIPRDWSTLIGERFGQLTVLAVQPPIKGQDRRIKVRCDCGQEKFVSGGHLTKGRTRSCGKHNQFGKQPGWKAENVSQ